MNYKKITDDKLHNYFPIKNFQNKKDQKEIVYVEEINKGFYIFKRKLMENKKVTVSKNL